MSQKFEIHSMLECIDVSVPHFAKAKENAIELSVQNAFADVEDRQEE